MASDPQRLFEAIEEGRLLLDEAARAGMEVLSQNGTLLIRGKEKSAYLAKRLFDRKFTVLLALAHFQNARRQ